MYTTFSVVESIPPFNQSSSSPSFAQFAPVVAVFSVRQSSSFVPLTSSNPVHARTFTFTFSSRTLSSRLTKSIPVHDPHLNPPFPPFHGFCSVPISDDRWDTRAALRTTHTPRISPSILRPSGLTTPPHSMQYLWFNTWLTQVTGNKIRAQVIGASSMSGLTPNVS